MNLRYYINKFIQNKYITNAVKVSQGIENSNLSI